mmetsp:Transcript_30643/g.88452  ORF Transcript_30643/g.88452 Transcript_30643/m.88452 type:complete len:265 (-) Transcript_30643:97-891(-)|eukprot:CAMPEP_0176001976 /NCGR_PEP_ID=MMETSP0120_2-20121206/407_1 /TAXON_ID=160619 /ORGANISM="Kryptoperidinium foliaceum, Strain CCMP 1326" /LENGTH=264 /DNA_ID=CAMNT_0017334547 /DNA_START=35 /DNA_END=829 /DNA_ORIENTATION=-
MKRALHTISGSCHRAASAQCGYRYLSTGAGTDSMIPASLRKCPALAAAAPKLREIFQKKSKDGVFPLFSPKAHEQVWKTVEIDRSRTAAVLVPLVSYEGEPSLLFTTRSSHLPTHASEVSYPGGHFHELSDQSLEDTALREAQEELLGDYPWDEVEIIGTASALPSIRGTPVTPVVAILPYEITADTFPGDPREVEEIFCVSLSRLMEIETLELSERFKTKIPVYPAADDKRIWGLTAVVTRPLLRKLFIPALADAGGDGRARL